MLPLVREKAGPARNGLNYKTHPFLQGESYRHEYIRQMEFCETLECPYRSFDVLEEACRFMRPDCAQIFPTLYSVNSCWYLEIGCSSSKIWQVLQMRDYCLTPKSWVLIIYKHITVFQILKQQNTGKATNHMCRTSSFMSYMYELQLLRCNVPPGPHPTSCSVVFWVWGEKRDGDGCQGLSRLTSSTSDFMQ